MAPAGMREGGLEWREPGCSMCVGMNGDTGLPGQRIASTSNRNFIGRQGRGVRTHLLSPATAVPAALTGPFTAPRHSPGARGRGVRPHLPSPPLAVPAAVTGHFTDVRRLLA